jgi:PAS domain S-box-containing protein
MPVPERRAELIAIRVLASLSALAGFTILMGWFLARPEMVQTFRGAAMQFNTALAITLLGAALFAQTTGRGTALALACAAIAALLGGSALLTYLTGWGSTVEQLGFVMGVPAEMKPYAAQRMVAPGRMAPHTAVALLTLSLGILGAEIHQRQFRIISVYLGAVASAIGVLGLFSYASGADVPAGWANVSRIALSTAIVLVVLGAAAVWRAVSWLRAGGPLRVVGPVLATIAGVTVAIGGWQMQLDYSRSQARAALTRQVESALAQTTKEIEERVRAVERIAARAALHGFDRFGESVQLTRADFAGVEAVSWSGPSAETVGIDPIAGNEYLIGTPMLEDPVRGPTIRAVQQGRRTVVSSPFAFVGHGRAVLVVAPIMRDDRILGFVVGRLDLTILFEEVLAESRVMEGARLIGGLRVSRDGQLLFAAASNPGEAAPITRTLAIRNLAFEATVVPSVEWDALNDPASAWVVLAVALLLAGTVGAVLFLWERGRAQAHALAAGEERIRLALQGANDGLFDWDLQTGQLYLAPRWKEMLGYTDSELPSSRDVWQERLHPDDRERANAEIERFIASREPQYVLEHRLLHRDGTYRWILARALGVRDSRGTLVRLIGAHADITVRRTLEDNLQQRTLELQRSNEELERFAYAASHDLQEPLRMVVSFTKLLERHYGAALDDRAREYIHFAVDGASRMQVMINDLLLFSRVSTRAKPLATVDTELVFAQAIRNLQAAIEESGAVVDHDPLPWVSGDATQLLQLFQNLIANAVKFRGEAPPRVRVSVARTGARWRFSVADNGIGIERKYQDRIFVIFQRLHPRDRFPGNGIGLSLCKRIVERHGGTISVDSTPGLGSTFHFTLAPAQAQPHGNDSREQHAA